MIPILFDANEKDFSTRGLGPLSDAVSCKVVEERNGSYELTMKYPKNGIHFEDIGLNKIIFAIPSPYRDAQPFRIYKMSTPMNGAVTIYAQHISYDLSGVSVLPFTGISVTDIFDKIKSNSINRNDFDFVGNSDFPTECVYDIPHTARQILGGIEGSVIDRFGGEYEFDKFTVRWNLNRGADNGVTVRYGKNLLTLNQDVDISQIVTGVIPYWSNMEGGTAIVGDRVNLDGEYTFERIIPLDLSQEFENAPSKEDLEARAKTYIDANYSLEPEINCTISFALIEQYEDYKEYKLLEKCDLCDIVTVQYPDLGINSTAKIVKIDTDVLKDRYNSVTLGSVRANIAQTIVAQQKAVEDVPTRKDVSGIVQGSLGNILGAQGGSIRLLDTNNDGQPDTLYIADNSNPIEAKKVWRFNYLGWAASENGYNGPFKMGATLNDGLLADFVTAANLVAGTIKSADDGASFSLDLSTGHINAKKLSWESENSSMSEDGIFSCKNSNIDGEIKSKSIVYSEGIGYSIYGNYIDPLSGTIFTFQEWVKTGGSPIYANSFLSYKAQNSEYTVYNGHLEGYTADDVYEAIKKHRIYIDGIEGIPYSCVVGTSSGSDYNAGNDYYIIDNNRGVLIKAENDFTLLANDFIIRNDEGWFRIEFKDTNLEIVDSSGEEYYAYNGTLMIDGEEFKIINGIICRPY